MQHDGRLVMARYGFASKGLGATVGTSILLLLLGFIRRCVDVGYLRDWRERPAVYYRSSIFVAHGQG